MKLIALAIPATQITVMSADRSGDSTSRSPSPSASPNGTRKCRIVTPAIDKMVPASTMPAIFAGADSPSCR